MEIEKALDIRFKQRQQYLEDPNYEKLSDILNNSYRGRRDNYLFQNLLTGNADTHLSGTYLAMEESFLENYKRHGINWTGIYNYYHARLESLHNGEWDSPEESDIEDVVDILETYEDKILNVYDAF